MLDSIEIALDTAHTWEPCPNWDDLRVRGETIKTYLEPLVALCLEHDPNNALLPLLGGAVPGQGLAAIREKRFRQAALQLKAGWRGDADALYDGGTALAGLGEGLTPAGDDFLAGLMLWAWLAHPSPNSFCRPLAAAAAPRTTTLSAAYLRSAARGQCNAAWHRLLHALAGAEPARVESAAHSVLAFGASSGLDTLIGFLYLSRKGDDCQ
jgi:hypothetical protein